MSIFNFALEKVPFAIGATSSEIAAFPDPVRGLGIAFDQSDGKPEMKGLNGLFNVITTSILYLRQRGVSEWVTDFDYPHPSWVSEGALLYKSKRASNSKKPSLSQSDWSVWASISDISVSTNGNLKREQQADGGILLEVPTGTTANRGAIRFANQNEVSNAFDVSAAVNPANALTIANSTDLGVGQKYRNVTGSRVSGLTYTNPYDQPIEVMIQTNLGSSSSGNGFWVGGELVLPFSTHTSVTVIFTLTVPPKTSYRCVCAVGFASWSELKKD